MLQFMGSQRVRQGQCDDLVLNKNILLFHKCLSDKVNFLSFLTALTIQSVQLGPSTDLSEGWFHTLENFCVGREGNGEGNGTPLQYSCLENPMDGGAW